MGCPISIIGGTIASQVVGGLLGGCCSPTTTAQKVGNAVQPLVSAGTAFELGCMARSCQQNINTITQAMYDAYIGKQNAIAKGYGVTCGAQPTNYTIGDVPLSQAVQAPTTRTASDIVSMPTSSGGITSVNTNAGKVPVLPAKAAHGGIMSTRHHYELGGSTPIGPAQGSFLNNPNYQQRQASLLNQVKSNPQLAMLLKQKLMQNRQKAMPTGFQGGAQLNPLSQNLAHGGRAHYDVGGIADLLQQQLQQIADQNFQNQLQENYQNQITDAQQSSGMNGLSSLPQDLLNSLKLSMGAQGLAHGGRAHYAMGTPPMGAMNNQSGIASQMPNTMSNTPNQINRIALSNYLKQNPQAMQRLQAMMQARQNPNQMQQGQMYPGGNVNGQIPSSPLVSPINQPQSNPFQNIAGDMAPKGLGLVGPSLNNQLGLAKGGLPNVRKNPHGVHEIDYRKTGGYVPPIGVKEKADDIPAMLSNNEFVFTADAVRKAGGGDVKEGARKMYALMKHLEGKK